MKQTISNDIAIIRLSEDVPLNHNVYPACLPSNDEDTFAGQTSTVVGWGTLAKRFGPISPIPNYGKVEILENSECRDRHKLVNFTRTNITQNMMCTSVENGQSITHGDSGGETKNCF